MTTPIVLPASASQDSLVNAIGLATSTGARLHLGPGVHFTRPGRVNLIPIGANGLSISAEPSSPAPAIIKRPDNAIDLAKPDDNHGLFFVPADPTPAEESQLTWRPGIDDQGPMEFDVIIRGRVTIDGVRIDCNMGNQSVESLPKDAAEHSCMLGFRGVKCRMSKPGDTPRRFAFVGFESVELTNLVTDNGGYSDDIWFSRGGFYPNIVNVKVDRLTSTERVIDRRRATLDFSGLCLNISIANCDIFKLGLEDTAEMLYSDLPRIEPEFFPSVWRLSDVAMDGLDLGARGRVYVLHAARLTTREKYFVDRAAGVIADSTFVVGDNRRLNRLDGLDFYNVHWILEADENGVSRGLKPTAAQGVPCKVSFIENTFTVQGASAGEIINSDHTGNEQNHVEVTALGCTYPEDFGADPARPIAKVNERGVWRFSQADLGTLDPDVALPKNPAIDVYRFVG